jgi:DICT domain-containing protein
MKTFVTKAYDLINERGLKYSPELFSKILKEVKENENNIIEEEKRRSIINSMKNKNFIADRMTAYGLNKRPY